MEKQNHEIRFKCSKDQHDKILERAKECGMTIKSFLLYLALKTKIKISLE